MNAPTTLPEPASSHTPAPADHAVRLGAVSFLNTIPLIEGLDRLEGVSLSLATPANLLPLLLDGRVDAVLAPVIDYQLSPVPLTLLPVGMIGSDGPTFTVRLYSRVPFAQIRTIAGDVDSHTSVNLARVILRRMHGADATVEPFDARSAAASPGLWPETVLLIGDKVVTSPPPPGLYAHELDFGQAWRELTGLPFAYAMWMCRADRADDPAIATACAVLDRQRRHNATRLGALARRAGVERGWPADVTDTYFASMLRFEVGPRERAAVDLFYDACAEIGAIRERRPTRWAAF